MKLRRMNKEPVGWGKEKLFLQGIRNNPKPKSLDIIKKKSSISSFAYFFVHGMKLNLCFSVLKINFRIKFKVCGFFHFLYFLRFSILSARWWCVEKLL